MDCRKPYVLEHSVNKFLIVLAKVSSLENSEAQRKSMHISNYGKDLWCSSNRFFKARVVYASKQTRTVYFVIFLFLCGVIYIKYQNDSVNTSAGSSISDGGSKDSKITNKNSDALNHDDSEFPLQYCNCKRKLKLEYNAIRMDHDAVPYNQTTCGMDAFRRGSRQKVVGFSIYGDMDSDHSKRKGYMQGIELNVELLKKFYPGWVIRLYFDLGPEDPILKTICDVACKNDHLDLCHVGKLPGTPMVDARKVFAMDWRFFPTLDPQVDIFLCRDLDSIFTQREVDAVNQWLESDKAIHSMRDHYAHGVPLLGAAWGAHLERGDSRRKWKKSWEDIFKNKNLAFADRSRTQPDQQVLAMYVWPWARSVSMQHDSYLCKRYPGSIPFPTKRSQEPNNFIAAPFIDKYIIQRKCPVECRPKDHQDWEYC